jgi:hypothetical protein
LRGKGVGGRGGQQDAFVSPNEVVMKIKEGLQWVGIDTTNTHTRQKQTNKQQKERRGEGTEDSGAKIGSTKRKAGCISHVSKEDRIYI